MRRRVLLLIVALLLVVPLARAQDDAPPAVPLVDEGGQDIVNILLIGSDTFRSQNAGRADVQIIVSVNRDAGTVGFLSLPRDLWVYLPATGMERINTAYGFGEHNGYEGGGAQLLADTIRHNLGIAIDHYARVDFNGFRDIVDSVGGIDLSVDCGLEDWKLISRDLDPGLEENWELFTLPVGVQHLDGDTALWYVRSRRTTNDLDRGRRQQAVLRALWRRIDELGLVNQVADIWPQLVETVRTDLTLPDALDLLPVALQLDSSRMAGYGLRPNVEIVPWRSPEGASLLLPEPDAVAALVRRLYTPPTASQVAREQARVEIANASGFRDFAQVAADRLALEGFVATILPDPLPQQARTELVDYTGRSKGGSLGVLQAALRIADGAVIVAPDASRRADFRVVLGTDYRSCNFGVLNPLPPETAEVTAEP